MAARAALSRGAAGAADDGGLSLLQVLNDGRMGASLLALVERLRGIAVWEHLEGRALVEVTTAGAASITARAIPAPGNASAVLRISTSSVNPTVTLSAAFAPLKDIINAAMASSSGNDHEGRILPLPFNLGHIKVRTEELKTWKTEVQATIDGDDGTMMVATFDVRIGER